MLWVVMNCTIDNLISNERIAISFLEFDVKHLYFSQAAIPVPAVVNASRANVQVIDN